MIIKLLEIIICIFGAWSISHGLVINSALPLFKKLGLSRGLGIYWNILLFVCFSILLLGLYLFSSRGTPLRDRIQIYRESISKKTIFYGGVLLLLGCGFGIFTLVISRPDADDVGYYTQMMRDVGDFSQPYTTNLYYQIGTPPPELYKPSPYESMVAVFARVTQMDLLGTYHNLAPFLASLVWVLTYAVVFRQIGFNRFETVLAVLASFVFLFLDGGLHRSFGNFSIVRLWQAKILAVSIGFPLVIVMSLRFLEKPQFRSWWILTLLVFGVATLNRTIVFFIPILVCVVSIAYFFSVGERRFSWKYLSLFLTPTYCYLLLGMLFWSLFIQPTTAHTPPAVQLVSTQSFDYQVQHYLSEWQQTDNPTPFVRSSSPASLNWWENLFDLVWGSNEIIVRNLLILFLLPLVLLPSPSKWFFILLSALLIFFTMTPWTGRLLIRFVSQGIYWRVYYLLPIPLCFGFLVLGVTRFSKQSFSTKLLYTTTLGVTLLVMQVSHQHHVLESKHVYQKSPTDVRVQQAPARFITEIQDLIAGQRGLLVEPVLTTLSLLLPNHLEYTPVDRGGRYPFHDILKCQFSNRGKRDFPILIRDPEPVDFVVMRRCDEAFMTALFIQFLPDGEVIYDNPEYPYIIVATNLVP